MLETALEKHRNGDFEEAGRLYAELLEAEPDNPNLLHLMGALKQDTGDIAGALELVRRSLELNPESAAAQVTLAGLLHRQGDTAGAREAVEKALALDPNLPDGHNTLGYLQYLAGELDAAETTLRLALRLDPNSDRAMTNLGTVLLVQGRPDDAVKVLQDALDAKPESLAARLTLGRAFLAQGAAGFAEECFRRCLEARPEDLQLKTLLGQALLGSMQVQEAGRLFDEVLADDPRRVDAIVGAAEVARARGHTVEASRRLQEALLLRRGDPVLLDRLADVLIERGEIDAALQIIGTLDGRLAPALVNRRRGAALLVATQYDEAAVALRQALKADPRDTESALMLAEALELGGQPEQARELLEGLPEDAPLGQRVKMALAALDLAEGDPQRVLERFDGMEIGQYSPPEQASIEELLGRALDAEGRYEEAAQFWRKIRRTIHARERRWREPAVSFEVAERWPSEPPDDGREEPVLMIGLPGAGVEAVAEALDDCAGIEVLADRHRDQPERIDCLTKADTRNHLSQIDEIQVQLARRNYWKRIRPLQRAGDPDTLLIDWLPLDRFDPVQVHRFFPGATVLVVDRHPGDLLLHTLSLGWREALLLGVDDLEAIDGPLNRARRRLGMKLIRLDPADLLMGRVDALGELAKSRGAAVPGLGKTLAKELAGRGRLLQFFPSGHWEHYAPHFRWDRARLEALIADRNR